MAGIEMIHTHSLIHDDLPAIDNDDYQERTPDYPQSLWRSNGSLKRDVSLLNYAYETMLGAFDLTADKDRVIRGTEDHGR